VTLTVSTILKQNVTLFTKSMLPTQLTE